MTNELFHAALGLLGDMAHAPLYNLIPIVALPIGLYHLYWMLNRKSIQLKNKVVFITGATSGLGKEMAAQFYKCGCKVILAARSPEDLEKTKSELLQIQIDFHPHPIYTQHLDLSKDDFIITDNVRRAISCWGNIDILVNNAGVGFRGLVSETNLSVHREIMQVNYFSQIVVVKEVLQSMLSVGEGTIICISSVQGQFAIPHRSAYAASKHACQAFYDSLRAEVAHLGVRVMVVNPGYINTNLSKNALTAHGRSYGKTDLTTSRGASVEVVARRVLTGVRCGESEVSTAHLAARLALLLRHLLPYFYFYLMRRRANLSS